MTVNAGGEL